MRRGEVAEALGISAKRIDLLRERGQLPMGSPNTHSEYTEKHVAQLKLLVSLLGAGLRPDAAKEIVDRNNGDAERVLSLLKGGE